MLGVPVTLYVVAVRVCVKPVSTVAEVGERLTWGVVEGVYVNVVLGIKLRWLAETDDKLEELYPCTDAPLTVLPAKVQLL